MISKRSQVGMPYIEDASAVKKLFEQFSKYIVVGGIAFVIDFGCLVFLTEIINIYYLISAAIAFIAGLTTNYILSIKWVFDFRKVKDSRAEFLVFTLIGIVGLGINEIVLWGFTEKLGFIYLYSKVISAGIVLLWNFGARKMMLF